MRGPTGARIDRGSVLEIQVGQDSNFALMCEEPNAFSYPS